ncbi:MAG: LruC domain-containing protein [Prevotellaceae bacterium]|jgi:hypothetical protein|nr:LruC domain-containing protein [Prevotellaceae bacterium]
MKTTLILWWKAWLLIVLLSVSGCSENVYDPTKHPVVPPQDNPLGQGFTAPEGFDWSLTRSIELTVDVNDVEFDGRYRYLVEVFTDNPMLHPTATAIAAAAASARESCRLQLLIPDAAGRLYVRQTDPRKRREIYGIQVPPGATRLTCRLQPQSVQTRASEAENSAFEAAQLAGFTEPTLTEASLFADIPTVSDPPQSQWSSGMNLSGGSNLIIDTEWTRENPFTKSLYVSGTGRVAIYVKGVWKPSDLWSAFDIYVLDGGKIETPGNLSLGEEATIAVQSGGKIEVGGKLTTYTKRIYNFGTMQAHELLLGIGSKGAMKLLNYGAVSVASNLTLSGCEIYNHGAVSFDETDGRISTNNSLETALINRAKATFKGAYWEGGSSIYNDGLLELRSYHHRAIDRVYNSCTFVAKESCTLYRLTLNNGSLTAGENQRGEWMEVPEINCPFDTQMLLQNGSVIKADRLVFTNSPNRITGGGGDISLLKAKTIEVNGAGPSRVEGNLVLECGTLTGAYASQLENNAVGTGYDESKYTVETCGGIFNTGNPGESQPSDPGYPIHVEDGTGYTFAFEDNWPSYGDFDMNDVVVSLDKIAWSLRPDGSVETYTLDGTLQAVGASKKLGLALRFLDLDATAYPPVVITEDAHRFAGNPQGDRTFINVYEGSANNRPGKPFEVTLTFAAGQVKPQQLNINRLDLYVISAAASKGQKQTEIHVAGFAPTPAGATLLFGTSNDHSSEQEGRYYLSNENLAWGIVIPAPFAWPTEQQRITNVYADFAAWVTSGGAEKKDWYTRNNGSAFE